MPASALHCLRTFMLAAALLLLVPWAAHGQAAPAFEEEVGYLGVSRERVAWPTPESLVAQLRSPIDQVRLKALLLMGLTEEQAHHAVWAQAWPTRVIGQEVATPDRVQLTYAALGNDAAQQAIIAAQDSGGQMTYAAVGVASPKGWVRVAAFNCWCKYEMYSGQDALGEFVQLRPAPQRSPETPQRSELVLKASGGGTGIYTQNEAHFRLHDGEVLRVLSFVSEFRSCPLANECTFEKRWFSPAVVHGQAGGVLVESRGRGRYTAGNGLGIEASIRPLENRHLGPATCREYERDEEKFQHTPAGAAEPCQLPR